MYLAVIAAGCSTSATKDPDSATAPHWEWAFFDGDDILLGEYKEFYVKHRVLSVNGYDLSDGRTARVKNQEINCLLRDCRLHPGQHEIYVGYSWASSSPKDHQHSSETLKEVGQFLSVPIQMAMGSVQKLPSGSGPSYACHFSLTFEAQPKHRYVLNLIHNELNEKPEQIQLIDKESGAVVASANPC